MKKTIFLAFGLLTACHSYYDGAQSDVFAVNTEGTGENIGLVVFQDTPTGLFMTVDLKNLPQGEHGFHIHENPDCDALADAQGKIQPALKAGGHYDPNKTGRHLGPNHEGHKGDLPVLKADANGQVKTSFYMPHLRVEELKNRAIVVHAGGDNYQDTPVALGGGGARIACGIIK